MPGGAPKGNTNAAKSKRLASVLKKRLEERAAESELMNVLLDKALDGDLAAIKEVFDRIDGKAAQSVKVSGDEDNPVTVQKVERVIVKPANSDS